ncbi:MAG: hypothetical protein J6X37_08355 [Treponema sp.]|nr:hypothetical protein [Treponema sp.]
MKDNKPTPFEIDFDSYILQSEPDKRENGRLWQTAIGLQQVDGLTPSKYLYETPGAILMARLQLNRLKSSLIRTMKLVRARQKMMATSKKQTRFLFASVKS